MKKWYLIDDCTRSKCEIFAEALNAETKEQAFDIASAQWERLSAHDQKERDAFFVCRAELDEDGCLDWNTMTDIVNIK